MKSMIVMALSFSALAACGTSAGGNSTGTAEATSEAKVAAPKADTQVADDQAKGALADVSRLVDGNYAPSQLELGEGFDVRYLNPVALAEWTGGGSERVSLPVNDRVYAVSAGGSVVGSITLHKGENGWETSTIGRGPASGKLNAVREQLRASHAADGNAYELVHVIGLNERFIGHHEQGTGFLTSLKSGEAVTARAESDVLGELSARARSRQ